MCLFVCVVFCFILISFLQQHFYRNSLHTEMDSPNSMPGAALLPINGTCCFSANKEEEEFLSLPPLPPPTCDRPCDHNNWDSVRVKRKQVLLRCRECVSQWKIKAGGVKRCRAFLNGACDEGASCPLLHINCKKQTKEERHAIVIAGKIMELYQKTVASEEETSTCSEHSEHNSDPNSEHSSAL